MGPVCRVGSTEQADSRLIEGGTTPYNNAGGIHNPYQSSVYTNLDIGRDCTGNAIANNNCISGMLNHAHYYLTNPGVPIFGGQSQSMMMITSSGEHLQTMNNCGDVIDCDPRELESFAEHFKQRRIKLGATQADVGLALGKLKIPGVGSLSQSTICRFESLTLSHNNMLALQPVLSAWLTEAELVAREARMRDELTNGSASCDRKRKRTSIAAPEKRSLEAYFAIQPRPSGEKIAQIADKLDLRKNVVRVWFCNQRQKQKRMKFSAASLQAGHH